MIAIARMRMRMPSYSSACATAHQRTSTSSRALCACVQVSVTPGEKVKAGQVVAVMSAMKMETTVGSPCRGVVSHVAVIKGDSIEGGDLIVRIRAAEGEGESESDDGGSAEAKSAEPAATAA